MNEYGTRLIFVCTLFLLGYGVFLKALLIFLFNFTQSNNSLFSVWHQLGPFYNGFAPFWFDKRHLRSAHDLFYLSIE